MLISANFFSNFSADFQLNLSSLGISRIFNFINDMMNDLHRNSQNASHIPHRNEFLKLYTLKIGKNVGFWIFGGHSKNCHV